MTGREESCADKQGWGWGDTRPLEWPLQKTQPGTGSSLGRQHSAPGLLWKEPRLLCETWIEEEVWGCVLPSWTSLTGLFISVWPSPSPPHRSSLSLSLSLSHTHTQTHTHTHTAINRKVNLGTGNPRPLASSPSSATLVEMSLNLSGPHFPPLPMGVMPSALPPSQPGGEAGANEIIFREKAFVNRQAPHRQAEGLVLAFPLYSPSLAGCASGWPLSVSGMSPLLHMGPLFSLGTLA